MIQNRLKAKRAKKFAVLLFLVCCVLLGTCSRQDREDTGATAAQANDLQTPRFRVPETTSRRLILEQGNVWGVGIPGFGVNAIPVLTGEYAQADRHFQVWLTREVLYFDTNWTPWPDLVETRSHAAAGGNLASRPLNGVWSVVFLFPDDFTPDEQAEIMRATAPRFTQFVSASNHVSDSSLPAIIEY